jgi:hypothetical protein
MMPVKNARGADVRALRAQGLPGRELERADLFSETAEQPAMRAAPKGRGNVVEYRQGGQTGMMPLHPAFGMQQ